MPNVQEMGPASSYVAPSRRRRSRTRRTLWVLGRGLTLLVLGLAAAIVWWSGATLTGDDLALARVEVQPLGGSLVSATAFASDGRPIGLSVHNGRVLPMTLLSPGERVSVRVVVRRPGWLGWALGHTRSERLSLRAPESRLQQRWLTVAHGALRVRFDQPVDRVSYQQGTRRRTVPVRGSRSVSLGAQAPSGTLMLASASRSWERLGASTRITWFPASRLPVVLVDPPNTRPIS